MGISRRYPKCQGKAITVTWYCRYEGVNKLDNICDICGKQLKTEGGLKQHKILAHRGGKAHQTSLGLNNNSKEEKVQDSSKEEKVQDSSGTFEHLSKLFSGDRRGLLSPPITEAEQKKADLNSLRLSTVQTAQVLIELASLLHPEKMQEVIEEFKDEPDFRRILILDWLDQTYRSIGKVYNLEELLVRVLKKEAVTAGILSEDEELPEAPGTKLGPVLEELTSRISVPRR